jgi:hypothetical protein
MYDYIFYYFIQTTYFSRYSNREETTSKDVSVQIAEKNNRLMDRLIIYKFHVIYYGGGVT